MITRTATAFLLPCLFLTGLSAPLSTCRAEDGKLHALLIGNSKYKAGELRNPANDAKLLGDSLTRLGFQVTVKTDLSHQQMDEAINEFSYSIPDGGLALFYFAGHGVQVDEQNFLIPVDAHLRDVSSVKYKTVSQSFVLDALHASDGNMKVVVLDCCRDNPFQRAWTRGASKSGLAATTEFPNGTLIAYATAPGETALDGKGDNSPYATQLAQAFHATPRHGLTLRDVFFTASEAVAEKTDQHPWMNLDASVPRVYLRPPTDVDATVAKAALPTPDLIQPTSLKSNPISELQPKLQSPKPIVKPSLSQNAIPADDSLLTQARIFHHEAKFDLAIESYTAIIHNSVVPEGIREQARQGRARALVGRGKGNDLLMAITDKKAVGDQGLLLPVLTDSVELKVDTNVTGKLRRNQIALVTQARADWLWVNSVQGDESIRGWVKQTAFVAKPKPAPSSKVTTSPRPANAATNPAGTLPQSFPRQPQSSGQPQYSGQQFSGQPYSGQQFSGQPQFSGQQNSGQQYSGQSQSQQRYSGQSQQRYSPQQFSNGSQSNQRYSNGQSSSRTYSNNQSSGNRQSGGIFRSNGILQRNSGDSFTRDYMRRNGRPPSIWETPRWESPREIKQRRRQGLLR